MGLEPFYFFSADAVRAARSEGWVAEGGGEWRGWRGCAVRKTQRCEARKEVDPRGSGCQGWVLTASEEEVSEVTR